MISQGFAAAWGFEVAHPWIFVLEIVVIAGILLTELIAKKENKS